MEKEKQTLQIGGTKMFEENEDLVLDTENTEETVEETTEGSEQVEETVIEPDKRYSEDDVNKKVDELLAKKIARKEAKIRKEYDKKYGKVEKVLTAGLGVNSLEEATTQMEAFYKQKGIKIPEAEEPVYSIRDMEAVAKAEAEDIISSGFDEVVEEVDRLAEVGVEGMTPREREVFKVLAEYRYSTERRNELSSIGVKEDVIESKEFKDFVSKFNSDVPIKDVYNVYSKMNNIQTEPIGSMKNINSKEEKTYYTSDEVDRLTPEQLDDPTIMKKVRESMLQW